MECLSDLFEVILGSICSTEARRVETATRVSDQVIGVDGLLSSVIWRSENSRGVRLELCSLVFWSNFWVLGLFPINCPLFIGLRWKDPEASISRR